MKMRRILNNFALSNENELDQLAISLCKKNVSYYLLQHSVEIIWNSIIIFFKLQDYFYFDRKKSHVVILIEKIAKGKITRREYAPANMHSQY